MAVNPYKVPIFSWVKRSADYIPGVRFRDVNTGNEEVFWFMGDEPVFPYFAFRLEEWLNDTLGDGVWKCRWVFEGAAPYSPAVFSQGREYDPKLAITTQSAAKAWEVTFSSTGGTFSFLPLPILDETYTTLDENWIGATITPQALLPPAAGGWRTIQAPNAPWGVWNPGVLTYSDDRFRENSVAQSVNTNAVRHTVRRWGERVTRTITTVFVPVSNVFAHRRLDPFYEQVAIRRSSPNNLFENLFRHLKQDDNTLWVWTEVGDPSELDSELYAESFKGRLGRVLATTSLSNLAESVENTTDDGRLVDLAIQVVEGGDLEQVIPPPCKLGV